MIWLASQPDVIFLGQSVKYDGAAIYETLRGVPESMRLEMPVIEDFQLGYATGLALAGKFPICIYPRMDFMLLAMNQLVNHLDKWPALAGISPRMIIRTRVVHGPLDAGPQHTQNHSFPFRQMLKSIPVIELFNPEDVLSWYKCSYRNPMSTILVEHWNG